MAEGRDEICYRLLCKVFRDDAYATLALNDELAHVKAEDRAYITKVFYGVLEKNVTYEYMLSRFAREKKPKPPIAVLIKMGYYLLQNTSVPAYATVNNIVSLARKLGKGGASGFVNAALRATDKTEFPPAGTATYLSTYYGFPLWLTEKLVMAYGYDFAEKFMAYTPDERTHIRVNSAEISPQAFAEKYAALDLTPTKWGYYAARKALERIPSAEYVVQSAGSIAAVQAYLTGDFAPHAILDTCAAPGGKAVLAASLTGAPVSACDIHPHRVELIRKYAAKCKADVTPLLQDATEFRPDWERKFDCVICDVPCSGIGVAKRKPDILFRRKPEDVTALAEVQAKILRTAARYVASGGRLCYSTCTVLPEENENIVDAFLAENPKFARVPVPSPTTGVCKPDLHLFGHTDGTDGFYVAVLQATS